jgi:hypothetical protein
MKNSLADAKKALGFGFTFLAYAAWLLYDYWQTKRKLEQATRAKLIYDDAGSRRAALIEQEFE